MFDGWEKDAEMFNLGHRLRNDPDTRGRMSDLLTRMADIEEHTGKSGIRYLQERNKIIDSIWRDCGHNFSLLTSFFFPSYPKGSPMSMLDRPFNMALMFCKPHWRFTLRGSRQIGKSTTMGVRARIISELVSRYSSLYVAPHTEPLKTFARKYDEISQAFRFPVQDTHKHTQNLYFRKYPSRSQFEMIRIQTSATPARGKTCDELLYDEVQLFDPRLETEVSEVQSDSTIPSILYTGTSTTFDTLLEYRYQEGTQATWHILRDNGESIDCGNPEQVIPCVGPYFMHDPDTKKKLDPLRGFYKFANPEGFEKRCFSIHIPQVINPDIAGDPLKWNVLHRTLEQDPDKFVQEKLGIPVEEASRELTKDDLLRICQPAVVGTPEERLKRARKGYYRMLVSGADWGGSDYNPITKTKESTTTHTILGVTPENNMHLLHAKRHGGMDYKTIMNLIAKDHQKFCVGGIATDYGVGETYHDLMRSHPAFNNGRHVIFHYTGPRSPLCNTMKGALSNTLNLNKTESITSLLLAMTMPEPMLLCPGWDEVKDFMDDFLNVHRVLSEKEGDGGQRQFRYMRNPSKRDDTVHSINFAYSLVRLAYNQILLQDNNARAIIRAVANGSDKSSAGSFHAPNAANQLIQQANQSWDQMSEDYYQTDEYQDYE